MKRFDALREIVSLLSDQLVICNLGIPSKELYYLKDREKNFYMLGSMGLASSIALGVAISKPEKRVWCIEGDGSILMNLGSLSTIANIAPKNLTLLVIDNKSYGSTGNQKTYTSQNTKLEKIAEGSGFKSIYVIERLEKIIPILKNLGSRCHFILIKTEPGNALVENIPLHPLKIKERFINSFKNNFNIIKSKKEKN
ncbi:MAG: sulfopyruvate decarboxylase subunit beta [Promethearchaeota archaeon]